MHCINKILLFFFAAFVMQTQVSHAQIPDSIPVKRQIYIINAQRLSYQKLDSVEFQSAAGNVIIRQDNTMFYSDSVVIDRSKNLLEAFGHVHINDADSVHTYADYLKYLGNEKKAYLRKNVRLTDGKGTLTTPDLDYDLNTKIGTYTKGGKVVNGTTVLNSSEGYYYGETRDIYFKKKVVLVAPDYIVKTDTLLYNTYTDVATFIVPTEITSGNNRKIITSDGYYDLRTKKAYFGSRPQIQDSTTFLIADEIARDDASGFGEARGNVIYRDTAQGLTVLANNLKNNSNDDSFLATQNPVMILKQNDDSVFIAADTFYSAKLTDLLKTRIVLSVADAMPLKPDSAVRASSFANRNKPVVIKVPAADTGNIMTEDAAQIKEIENELQEDTSATSLISDSTVNMAENKTTPGLQASDPSLQKDSSNRFIEAYSHVRIFSDSLQAAGDSLFYSAHDSTFRLFKQPVVWAQQTQLTGDTIYLYTNSKKPDRIYIFENALSLELVGPDFYNQIKGRTMSGWFTNGNIDQLRARGNAESVYYALDDAGKYLGVNKNSSDVIDIFFEDKAAKKVVFRSNLAGTAYPMRQVNHEEIRLRGFNWQSERRPKTKYDLFGQ